MIQRWKDGFLKNIKLDWKWQQKSMCPWGVIAERAQREPTHRLDFTDKETGPREFI